MDLTKRVRDKIHRYNIKQGLLILSSLHTTTALFINEWQEALLDDLRVLLETGIATTTSVTPTATGATRTPTFVPFSWVGSSRCRWSMGRWHSGPSNRSSSPSWMAPGNGRSTCRS
jgi:thiamine phosphate synthase YjbQ (UPF0047 family)